MQLEPQLEQLEEQLCGNELHAELDEQRYVEVQLDSSLEIVELVEVSITPFLILQLEASTAQYGAEHISQSVEI